MKFKIEEKKKTEKKEKSFIRLIENRDHEHSLTLYERFILQTIYL